MSAFDAADTVWFFNIGALMNKVSVRLRGIETLESRPGVLRGFTLGFRGSGGMATAARRRGRRDARGRAPHHAREPRHHADDRAHARLGRVRGGDDDRGGRDQRVACCVFVMQPEFIDAPARCRPRHVALLVEGAEQHGLAASWVARLRAQPMCCGRRAPSTRACRRRPRPRRRAAAVRAMDDAHGRPLGFSLNGKVYVVADGDGGDGAAHAADMVRPAAPRHHTLPSRASTTSPCTARPRRGAARGRRPTTARTPSTWPRRATRSPSGTTHQSAGSTTGRPPRPPRPPRPQKGDSTRLFSAPRIDASTTIVSSARASDDATAAASRAPACVLLGLGKPMVDSTGRARRRGRARRARARARHGTTAPALRAGPRQLARRVDAHRPRRALAGRQRVHAMRSATFLARAAAAERGVRAVVLGGAATTPRRTPAAARGRGRARRRGVHGQARAPERAVRRLHARRRLALAPRRLGRGEHARARDDVARAPTPRRAGRPRGAR